ncbi:MAG: hypothetical protein PHX08_01880 [Lachnospiraceae bacterium]|nr:hypothetical protein [Lachnospiraceae bacterium]
MDGLTISEIIKYAVDVGMTPILLIVFVVFFINKAKDDDEKIKDAYTDAQVQMEKNSKAIREREDMLMAESAKREEIIRSESEKRECLIRREAEKRESILMSNSDRMLDSLGAITNSLQKIENAFSKMEYRLEKIETKINASERKKTDEQC